MVNSIDIFSLGFELDKYPLIAYKINAKNAGEVGAVLAARVRKMRNIPCAWVKNERILVAPTQLTQEILMSVVKELWEMRLEGFDLVLGVNQEESWQPSPNAIAQFVVKGILDDAKGNLKAALKAEEFKRKTIIVERQAKPKGTFVEDSPALQITVKSPMSSTQKLQSFYNPNNPNSLIGIAASCKDTSGVVESLIGTLGEHRERLQGYKPTDYDATLLETLPDNHPIVALRTYSDREYHYPLQVLDIVVDLPGLKKLGLTESEAKDVITRLKIAPAHREKLVSRARESLVKFVGQSHPHITIGMRYNSDDHPEYFATIGDFGLDSKLRFGSGTATINKDTEMLKAIYKYGLYQKAPWFQQDNTIQFAVVDVVAQSKSHSENRKNQLVRFAKFLNKIGLQPKSTANLKVEEQERIAQRAQLTEKLNEAIKAKPHIIIIYLPYSDSLLSDDDNSSLYNTAKNICIKAGAPSQVIYENTIGNEWADDNILMGIMGKTGNIPYVLDSLLNYTDVIVGLDVSRRRKTNARGTMNMAALSRVYTNSGALLGYAMSGTMVEGEIIPQYILERILPEEEFGGKRAIVHRDGRYVGDELQNIWDWGKQIGAEFLPIEVTKSGVPRFYKEIDGVIYQADKGTAFSAGDNSVFVVSSPPPAGQKGAFSTSVPLQVTNFSNLSLEDAVHSVLALTLLHYGSVRSTRLPVSTHASDKIAGFLSRNIRPDVTRGDVPFWL